MKLVTILTVLVKNDIVIYASLLSVHTDKETTKFIEDQKTQKYEDLRHALQVMGKIASLLATHILEHVCVCYLLCLFSCSKYA